MLKPHWLAVLSVAARARRLVTDRAADAAQHRGHECNGQECADLGVGHWGLSRIGLIVGCRQSL